MSCSPLPAFDYAAETKIRRVHCPLCTSLDSHIFCRQDKYGHRVDARQCAACQFRWLGLQLTPAGYSRFYGSGEYRRLCGSKPAAIQAGQRHYAANLQQVLGNLEYSSLVDLGGSCGIIGQQLGAGCRSVTIVDPSPSELAAAAALGLDTRQGTAETYEPGAPVDLVTLIKTIDHLPGPVEVLQKIRGYSRYLLIDFVDYFGASIRFGRENMALKIDHPCYFTTESANRCLAAAGWQPKRAGWFAVDNVPLHFVVLAKHKEG